MKRIFDLENEAIKEGKLREEDGLGFNKYYAKYKLNKGERIFFHSYENGKHEYKEVTIKNTNEFPVNDQNGYLSSDYMTIEIVSDIVSNTRFAGAIINAEKH